MAAKKQKITYRPTLAETVNMIMNADDNDGKEVCRCMFLSTLYYFSERYTQTLAFE